MTRAILVSPAVAMTLAEANPAAHVLVTAGGMNVTLPSGSTFAAVWGAA